MYSGMAFSFLLRTVQSWIVRINTSQKQIIQFFLWDLWLQPKKHRTSPKHLGYSSVSRHQGVKRCIFWSADNVETHEALLPGETAQVYPFHPIALWAIDSCSFNPKSYVLFDSPCGRIPFFWPASPVVFWWIPDFFFCNLLIPVTSIYLTS